jgi:hypothetical protein
MTTASAEQSEASLCDQRRRRRSPGSSLPFGAIVMVIVIG